MTEAGQRADIEVGGIRTFDNELLGTPARFAFFGDGDDDAGMAAALAAVAAIDDACSRFRDDSELAKVNSRQQNVVTVTPLLAEVTAAALRAARLTSGALDPTVGLCLLRLEYTVDFRLIQDGSDAPLPIAVAAPGWHALTIDLETRQLTLPRSILLDLDVVAKAMAIDNAAAAAAQAAQCGVLACIGGDIAVAGPAPMGGWIVRVSALADDDAPGQLVTISSGGMATSGTRVRRWRRGEREVHHIIDPTTGEPVVEHFIAASVAAASCLDANIGATASIVMRERAPAWLAEAGLPARLVDTAGQVSYVGEWPGVGDEA